MVTGMSNAALFQPEQVVYIDYEYDPLYRLTKATYSGGLSAEYGYLYDAVGNMTAYTETVGADSTIVTRTFDAANELQTADDGLKTTYYTYDGNGNLTISDISAMSTRTTYTYNQRNLLTSQTLWSLSEPSLQAEYFYDGSGDRMQQVDYSAGITITYTNDILGLTQVLVADDGTTRVYNLFGLDLIHQEDGTVIRFLLTDGLGSVRTEMVGSAVDSVTTYSPYGSLLAQTGTSGTTYGFTGEQHDNSTGLLYLRARYYNSYITFGASS